MSRPSDVVPRALVLAAAVALAAAACKPGEPSTTPPPASRADPLAWRPVADTGPCVLEEADPSRLAVLPLTWAACGPGCSTAPARVLDSDDTVFDALGSARAEGDDVVVRLGTIAGGQYYLIALRRLSDGALLAAARAPGPTTTGCNFMGHAPSAPRLFPFMKGAGKPGEISTTGTVVVAQARQAGQKAGLVWSPPVADVPLPLTSAFENDLGWGMALNDGSVRARLSAPGSAPGLAILDRAGQPAHSAVGWKRLVVSNPVLPGSADEVVRVWEPDRPPRTIVAEANTGIPGLALSDAALVWVATHGAERASGTYAAAELAWSRPPAGEDRPAMLGKVTLPDAKSGLLSLQTAGDIAAVTGGTTGGRAALFVVRLSDGRVWTLRDRPGAHARRVLAVSPSQILVAEIDAPGDPSLSWQIQRLTRYDLARLDDLSSAW